MGRKESNQTNKAAYACIKKTLPVLVDPVHKVWDFSHVHAAEPRLTLHFLHTHAYKNTRSLRNNIYACALNTTISWTDRTLHVYLILELIFDHHFQTCSIMHYRQYLYGVLNCRSINYSVVPTLPIIQVVISYDFIITIF